MRKRVGILIFDDIEVLDFTGPYEVLSATRLDESKRREEPSPFEVVIVAEKEGIVKAQGGLKIIPDYSFQNCPLLDVLVVPGGWGTRREIDNKALTDWIKKKGNEAELITSVCTGAVLLGKAGLLKDRKATTHWKAINWMRELFPEIEVVEDQHVVKDERVFTSAGISAGIDMALHIVGHYFGDDISKATCRHMEYSFSKDNKRHL
ncbi:MAG: DJ-1/PfpI family protein [Desulfobacteraceae bacterium]|nr:DJ-1/PfpI family protein [Desulfobacteraceae bacterium]